MDGALFTLCRWWRTKDQLPYVGCYFWNLKPLFDLVVSIHAGVPRKLADKGLPATFSVFDRITAHLSPTFPFVSSFLFNWLPLETLNNMTVYNIQKDLNLLLSPVNICLPCSSLSDFSNFRLLPSLSLWHDKCFQLHLHRDWTRDWISPLGVEIQDLHTLYCPFALNLLEYFTETCPNFLYLLFTGLILFCHVVRKVVFFPELIMLFHLLLCVSFLC